MRNFILFFLPCTVFGELLLSLQLYCILIFLYEYLINLILLYPGYGSYAMIIEKELYDRCCRAYQRVIDELEEKLDAINAPEEDIPTLKQCFSIIMEVSQSYLLPKVYWRYCLDYLFSMESLLTEDDLDFLCSSTAKRALFHLHFDEEWNQIEFIDDEGEPFCFEPYGNKHFKFMNFYHTDGIDSDAHDVEEEDLCFPHSRLKECLRYFEQYINATCIPSKKLIKRCEEMIKLYPKIVSAYEDVDKWFNLLLEVDDFAFVKDNIEYRLGKDFVNVHLWKIYFGFLKKHGEYKSLLKAYSKYCRFFLDDKEMLDEYKKVMIEHGPVKLEWKNLFDFEVENNLEGVAENETPDVEMEDVEPLENESADVEMEEVEPFDKKICSLFYDTYQHQNFSLPGPQIFYILDNADHRMLRQLFASCKYFFVKHPTPICYGLSMRYQTSFEKENLYLSHLSNQIMFVKKTFITGILKVYYGNTSNLSANDPERLFISSLIPHLFRCEAKYLCILDQSLSFDEVKFLIAHGNVVEFHLSTSTVLDENGQYVHLEEIMKYLPNVEELYLPNIKVNSNTGHALTKLNFNGKISIFSIHAIFGVPFDGNEFLKFVKANRDDKLDLRMKFNKEFNLDFVAKLIEIMDDYKISCGYVESNFYITSV